MKNDLFTIGSLTIHGYGLMIGLGIIAAYLLCEYRANRKGLDSDPLISIALWGVGGGLICAKLLYYITTFDEILEDPSRLLDLGDGFVVYGGIIGGIFGGWLYTRIKKLPFWKYFDLVMPAVALAQGFGRIGCFLAGCCYGLQMESPISIVFTHSDFAPNGVPLLPTQLISSGLDFLHCLILPCRVTDMLPAGNLGKYQKSQFIAPVQKIMRLRIVRSTHGIDTKLLF